MSELERRWVANDMLAIGQTALAGGIVAEMAATYRTPTQVMMRGWGANQAVPPKAETDSANPLSVPSLSHDESDRFFLDLSVTPPAKEEAEAPPTREVNPPQPPKEDTQPDRLVSASTALGDPLLDADFLHQLAGVLNNPISEASMDEGAEKTGGGGGGGFSASPTDTAVSGGFSGADAPASAPGSPSPSGGGMETSGSSDGMEWASLMGAGTSLFVGEPALPEGPGIPTNPPAEGSLETPRLPLPAQSLARDFAQLPLAFEANQGQTNADAQFIARGNGYAIFLTSEEAVLALPKTSTDTDPAPGIGSSPQTSVAARDVLRVQFVGAREDVELRGQDELFSRSNYFRKGSDPLALTDIANYSQVVARNIYDGVDVVYQGAGHDLRFDFVVEAGADFEQVGLRYVGAESVTVDEQGRLVLEMAGGTVIQDAPVLYQDLGGEKQSVVGRYVQRPDGSVGFTVEAYDRNAALVIDPTITLGTYFGGTGSDVINGVATDAQNNIYVVGTTTSTDFPTEDPYDDELDGTDVFVSKLSADGSTILYSTYLGGEGSDYGLALAVDDAGYAYVTGQTDSADFPTTTGAYDETLDGTSNVFVTKLSSSGDSLSWSTLLGAEGDNSGRAIAVDGSGDVYVVGIAQDNFPTDNGVFTTFGGNNDAFVTKLNSSGTALVWSNYLGGSSWDEAVGLAVDASERVYVAGTTYSSDFPTENAYDDTLGYSSDAFVARFAADGQSLDWSSYLGGSSADDIATGLAIDAQGRPIVVGYTGHESFPTTVGAWDTSFNLSDDAFVTRFESDGSDLSFSTFLGGESADRAYSVAVDGQDNIYVAGLTWSEDFPRVLAEQSVKADASDAFITRIAEPGDVLEFSSFLGGNGEEAAKGLVLDADANIVVVGSTGSTDFPTQTPFQGANGGGEDGFVTRFDNLPPPRLLSISTDSGDRADDLITTDATLSFTGVGRADSTITVYRAGVGPIGTTTADGDGDWTFNYTGTSLAEGTHGFTFTTTLDGYTGEESRPYLVTVDTTDPVVELFYDASTYDTTPELLAVAWDETGLPDDATVSVDVDLNGDSDYLDAGETGYAEVALGYGMAYLTLDTGLDLGSYNFRARVTDWAGNESISDTETLTVADSGSAWTTTDVTVQVDALQGDALWQRGNLLIVHDLDWDLSPGREVGLNPALVYNSERVDVRPIIQATVQSDSDEALPSTITAQLTFNGNTQTAQSFSTTGRTQGELLTVAQRVESAVLTTGYYQYTMTLVMDYGSPITRTVSGGVYVVAEDSSPYGAGWTFAGVDRLATVTGGVLRVYGAGGHGFYEDLGGGAYASPNGDAGTLTYASGTYTYEIPNGQKWEFDDDGYQVRAVSTDGKAVVTYAYDSGKLDVVQTPDGARTTVTYYTGPTYYEMLTGTREVEASFDGASNRLASVGTVGGSDYHSFGSTSEGRVTSESRGGVTTTFAYDQGILSGWTMAGSGAVALAPQVLAGLAGLTAGTVRPSVTDGLGRTTFRELDTGGRVTAEITPDGGRTDYTRDGDGWVTGIDDALGRHTTITLDGAGYATGVEYPDGRSVGYEYGTYHRVTEFTDERGMLWTSTYDGEGHQLTVKDPLGFVTTSTYNSTTGLRETVKDALGRVTTSLYDAARRLETTIHALGDRATIAYDGLGNVRTTVDELGRVTTYTRDVLGRETQRVDAAGTEWNTEYNSNDRVTRRWSVYRDDRFEFNDSGLPSRDYLGYGSGVAQTNLYRYDEANQLTDWRDPTAVWGQQRLDGMGRLQGTTDGLQGTTRTGYDRGSRATRSFDELGRLNRAEYDARDRVTERIDALGKIATTVYDEAGNVAQTIDPRGLSTTFAYDGLGREIGRSVGTGTGEVQRTSVVFDAVGNVVQRYDALGRATSYAYDALNRVTTLTEAVGTSAERTMTVAYDAVGNQTSETDWRGYRNESTYDVLNRRTVYREAVNASSEEEKRTTTYAYDGAGNIDTVIDSLGRTAAYEQDVHNRLTRVTEASGTGSQAITTTSYDARNAQVARIDPNGFAWRNTFDVKGQARFSIDPLGNKSRSLSDAAGGARGGIDPLGNRTQVQTDARGQATKVKDAAGQTVETVYDDAGNVWATVDALGNRTTFTYDILGRQKEVMDALGKVTTTIYDAVNNVLATVDARGYRTSYVYDALNRQIEVKDALGRIATSVYDDAGNLTVRIDPLLHRTTFAYDAQNRRVSAEDAEGNTAYTFYDKLGNVVAEMDARGYTVTHVYDDLNRRVHSYDEVGSLGSWVYDTAGRTIAEIDGRGNATTLSYDLAGRQTARTDALNHTATSVYDAAGNLSKNIDAAGYTTTFGYDTLNRRIAVQDPGGGINTTVYDAASRVVASVDPLAHRTTFAYDAVGRLKETTDARGFITTQLYDDVGNRTTLVDPVGNRTTFTFDALNRVWTETDPYSKVMTYAYDEAGRHTATTDRLSRQRLFGYDDANRATGEIWKDNAGVTLNLLTYTLDENGNREVMKDGNGTYTFAYDARNRVTEQRGPFGVTLTFTCDLANNRTEVRDNFGGITTSVYNAVNLLTHREFTDGTTTLSFDQEYSSRNQITTITRYSDLGSTKIGESLSEYDAAGRLKNLKHRDGSSNVLANYTYTYDLASRVTSETLNGVTTSYGYDQTNQLANDSLTTFTYDGNGNRTMSGYATTTGNRMTNDGTFTYTYDFQGNVTKKSMGASAETWTYTWDSRNQMTGVEKRATDGGTLLMRATYVYDVWGNRIEKQVYESGGGTTTERYVNDGWKNAKDGWGNPYPLMGLENFDEVIDLDGTNALTVRRLYGDGVDNPLTRVSAAPVIAWYLVDYQGSVQNLADGSGSLLATVGYDGFGGVATVTNAAALDRKGYAGYDRDAETGLLRAGESVYDPATGRWMRQDRIWTEADGTNQYRNVGNNTPNAKDASGLYELDVHFSMTYFLGLAAGLPDDTAYDIAWADQFADVHLRTQPMPCQSLFGQVLKPQIVGQNVITNQGIEARLRFHFPTEGPGKKVEAGSKLSKRMVDEGIQKKNPFLVGIGLHTYQDSWSHEGFSPGIGHALAGHDPDRPFKNVKKATIMAKATYEVLVEYRKAVFPGKKARLAWDDKALQQLLKERLEYSSEKETRRAAYWLGDLGATFKNVIATETENKDWGPTPFPIWGKAADFKKHDPKRHQAFEEAMGIALKMPTPWQVTPEHVINIIKTIDGMRGK